MEVGRGQTGNPCDNGCVQRREVRKKGGESVLINYVKVLLYVYPGLKGVARDYEEHVRNKAILSCDGRVGTEKLMEYLASEILEKRKIEALKEKLDGVMDKLTDKEKGLVELRYFRRRKRMQEVLKTLNPQELGGSGKYFRIQSRVLKKIGESMKLCGLTEETFFEEYAHVPCIATVYKYVASGRCKASPGERALIELLSNGEE